MVFITLTNARALRIGPRIAAQWHRHLGAELLDSLPDTQSRWVLGQWADRAAVLWKRWKCRMAAAWKQRVPNDSRRQNESWEYGRSAPLQSLWAPERSSKPVQVLLRSGDLCVALRQVAVRCAGAVSAPRCPNTAVGCYCRAVLRPFGGDLPIQMNSAAEVLLIAI